MAMGRIKHGRRPRATPGLRRGASGGSTPRVEVPLRSEDLAPGDRSAAERDWSELRVHRIREVGDPDFEVAYQRLFTEFGSRGEMEARAGDRDRLAWGPARPVGRAALAYELLVLRQRALFAAAARPHPVVRLDPAEPRVPVRCRAPLACPGRAGATRRRPRPPGCARCRCRRRGAAPRRRLPCDAGRVGGGEECRIRPGPSGCLGCDPTSTAGFQKVDPARRAVCTPDFRAREGPAGALPPPIPLSLILRRVGRESAPSMPSGELAAVVDAIYAVYGVHMPACGAGSAARRGARCWTARQPSFRLLHRQRDRGLPHPGFAAPDRQHVMPSGSSSGRRRRGGAGGLPGAGAEPVSTTRSGWSTRPPTWTPCAPASHARAGGIAEFPWSPVLGRPCC